MSIVLWLLAGALILVGLAGVVLPALPGTVLVFAGLLLAAWIDDFTRVGPWTLVVLGVMTAASYGIDFIAAALGTRHLGASRRAMAGAAVGTILGLAFGLPGLLLGPFLGAVLGELSAHGNVARAGRVGVAAWIGFAIGTAVKVAVVFTILGIFVAAFFLF
jgi:uncharacterized protein YqgC (DUF456 family)